MRYCALTIEPMNGAGAIGQVACLTPVYDDRAENVPASLIAKLSHADPDLKLGFFDLYARESQVYQSLLDQIKLIMPHCYYCDLRQETGDSILLLEDLGHLRQATFAQGCSLEDVETVITHFARHHAHWWESPQLVSLDFLECISTSINEDDIANFQAFWDAFEGKVTAVLPDYSFPKNFLDIGYRFARRQEEIACQVVDTPLTMVHNDVHVDNLMFARFPEDPALTVLDWQGCGVGPGVRDIGYFMMSSLTVKDRRRAERKLLQTYHTTLVEQGVCNYTFEQCWRDYRLAFFRNLKIYVLVASFADLSTPFIREAIKAMIPRLVSFAEDHRVEEFL